MNSLVKTLACGSGLLAVVVAASLSGCSSSSDSNATGGTSSGGTGGTSAAGSSAAGTHNGAAGASDGGTGGSLGSAGADTSAAGADTSAAGADTGAAGAGAEGSAVAKFCNQVQFGTMAAPMDITLRLEIGTAPNLVTFSTLSGTCTPMTGACKSIPVGASVPYSLIDPAGDAVLDSGTITVADGKEYVLFARVDDTLAPPAPILDGGSLTATTPMCSDFQYSDL